MVAVVAAVVVALVAVVVIAVLVRALGEARRRADALVEELAAVSRDSERALSDAADEVAALRAEVDGSAALVQSLWALELLRVAREWAVTGGPLPGDGSVAADTGAELTMALHMELERQREETGVPGDLVAADVGPVPVATALAALRLVEEALAVVSRPADGLTVTAAVDAGDVVVRIVLDDATADVPPLLRELAKGAGATVIVDGGTVAIRVPA